MLRQPNKQVLSGLFGSNGDQAWLRTTDYLCRLAGTLAQAGQPVWLYCFDYQAPGGPGPVHAQELGYVWNTLKPPATRSAAGPALG